MKQDSLESHIKRLAFGWTVAGICLTMTLVGSLSLVLTYKDTERQIDTLAASVIASTRTEILSGDIRSIELRLKKELGILAGESLLFLDEKASPWVSDLHSGKLEHCQGDDRLCRSWFHRKVVLDAPIYFDEEGKNLWGYLHIERSPQINWSLILSVAIAVVSGMLFLGLGFYFNLKKAIHSVSATLSDWAEKLSANPKDSANYEVAPFSEISPIGNALSGLKAEIDLFEQEARQQGALIALRGIGHDVLNPVSRMKRILGTLQIQGELDRDTLLRLNSNLKRLSIYAEQLKLIYKRKKGEGEDETPVLDISNEVNQLAKELLDDPERVDKKIRLQVSVAEDCRARIPSPALSRMVENLCANSFHASPDGATVSLQVQSEETSVSISVWDEGTGIPEKFKSRIFEADFTTKSNHGTGLGLFVVKEVCEQYGGRVSFRSEPGNGTQFKLEFPKAEVKSGL